MTPGLVLISQSPRFNPALRHGELSFSASLGTRPDSRTTGGTMKLPAHQWLRGGVPYSPVSVATVAGQNTTRPSLNGAMHASSSEPREHFGFLQSFLQLHDQEIASIDLPTEALDFGQQSLDVSIVLCVGELEC